jgi:transaldolase
MAMAEIGCEHATIPEDILLQLSILQVASNNPPPGEFNAGLPSPRLAHMLKVDPLNESWDGVLPPTDVDYLADNGAFLERLIEADLVTKKGLRMALEAFGDNEAQSRAAVEEVMNQV